MHYGKVIIIGSLKGRPAANPIRIILCDKVCQAWYCAQAMEKTRLLGISPRQPLTSRHSSWFFHRCCELGMLAGFSIPDVRSLSTQRKFNPKGFHQESKSLFHHTPAKPLRLESSSKLHSPWPFNFFPPINRPIALASGYLQKCSLSILTLNI